MLALLPVADAAKSTGETEHCSNVAIILLPNEISCYGGKNLKTPNIDRIAEEGNQIH